MNCIVDIKAHSQHLWFQQTAPLLPARQAQERFVELHSLKMRIVIITIMVGMLYAAMGPENLDLVPCIGSAAHSPTRCV